MTINPESNITVTVGGNAVRNVSGTLTDTITGKGLITMENNESEVKNYWRENQNYYPDSTYSYRPKWNCW